MSTKLFTLTALVLAASLAQAQDTNATISPTVIPTGSTQELRIRTKKSAPFPDCADKNPMYIKRLREGEPMGAAKEIKYREVKENRTLLDFFAYIRSDEGGEYGVYLCLAAPPGPGVEPNGYITVVPKAVFEKLEKMPKDFQPDITALNRNLASANEQLQAAKAKIAELEKSKTDLSPVEGRVTALENKPEPASLTREQVGSQINDRVAPLERRVDSLASRADGVDRDLANVSGANQAVKNGLADLADAVAESAERRKRTWIPWKKKERDPRLARKSEQIESSVRGAVK